MAVKFRTGLQSDYDALATPDPDSLYFCSDTHRLYKGAELFSYEPTPPVLTLWDLSSQMDGATQTYSIDPSIGVTEEVFDLVYNGLVYFEDIHFTVDTSTNTITTLLSVAPPAGAAGALVLRTTAEQ